MKLHNQKTNISFVTRTTKHREKFVSIVERWETDAMGVPIKAHTSSREMHNSRSKAYAYACTMARYQFAAHCAVYGA